MTHPKVKVEWNKKNAIVDANGHHEYLDMTMVSVFYDAGINELRKVATRKAAQCWMKQSHLPKEMVFIELGFNGVFTFSKEDFPKQIEYIRIDGNDSHKYLFQKEHLWNIAAKRAKYEKLMFVDSDIAPLEDFDWFKQVYDALDKCLFTQGFRSIQYLDKDDKPTSMKKLSYTTSYLTNGTVHPRNGVPGGIYCISKTTLQGIGYFNSIIYGGGDTLFWDEIVNQTTPRMKPICSIFKREYVRENLEILSGFTQKQLLMEVPVNVVHFFHGEFNNRSYSQRDKMWLSQYPLENIIVTDDNGLLSWIDTNYWYYSVMQNFHSIKDKQSIANSLMKDHIDYNSFYREFTEVFNDENRYTKFYNVMKLMNMIRRNKIRIQRRKL